MVAPAAMVGRDLGAGGFVSELTFARNGEEYFTATIANEGDGGGLFQIMFNESFEALWGRNHLAQIFDSHFPYNMCVARGSGWHVRHQREADMARAVLFGLHNNIATEWSVVIKSGNAFPVCINNQLYYGLWVPVVREITVGANGFATVTRKVN